MLDIRTARSSATGISFYERNIMDTDAAWELVMELHRLHLREQRAKGAINNHDLPYTGAILKHTNPCGVGVSNSALDAFQRAKSTDPVSAFGGIIAFSGLVDEATAKEVARDLRADNVADSQQSRVILKMDRSAF